MFWLFLLVYLAAQNPIAILRKLMDLFEDADRLRNDDGSTLLKYVQRVIKVDTSISMLLMFTLRGAVSFIFRQTMIKLKAFEVQFPTWFPASIRCPAFECLLWTGRLLTSNRTQMRCFVFGSRKWVATCCQSYPFTGNVKVASTSQILPLFSF